MLWATYRSPSTTTKSASGMQLGFSAEDAEILGAALRAGLVFVTFDVHTVPEVLRRFAESGEEHADVVLVSARSFRQDDVGGLAEALGRLRGLLEQVGPRNRVMFLERPA